MGMLKQPLPTAEVPKTPTRKEILDKPKTPRGSVMLPETKPVSTSAFTSSFMRQYTDTHQS